MYIAKQYIELTNDECDGQWPPIFLCESQASLWQIFLISMNFQASSQETSLREASYVKAATSSIATHVLIQRAPAESRNNEHRKAHEKWAKKSHSIRKYTIVVYMYIQMGRKQKKLS